MISLEVPEDELKTRLKQRAKISGRVDDQDPIKIQTRLDIYAEETLPVAAYYYQQEKLVKVNGVGSIDEIFREICTALDPLQS